MNDLVNRLLDCGLVQFGLFDGSDNRVPVLFSLEMLPSYPVALRAVISAAEIRLADLPVERLLCTAEAVPIGIGLSLQRGIPLVYSRGSDREAVFDLVGAYDIGHPALLLTGVLADGEAHRRLIRSARQVGLDVRWVLAVIDASKKPVMDDVEVFALLHLGEIVKYLVAAGALPAGQGSAVMDWLETIA